MHVERRVAFWYHSIIQGEQKLVLAKTHSIRIFENVEGSITTIG